MKTHKILTIINCTFILFLSRTTSSQATTLKPLSNCRKPLGMDDGAIPNSAISASSTYNDKDVGPINARIRNDKNGGAWCPKNVIKDGVYEWIQIDLQAVKVITHVETQGRFAKGQGKEFVSKYRLEYKRVDGGKFVVYKDNNGNENFTGNTDTHKSKINEINPPIISRWIRLVPLDDHANMVCLRLELHGCPWRDGILSYNMPQGEERVGGLELFDLTYDGEIFYVPENNNRKTSIAEKYSEKVKTKKIKNKNNKFSNSKKSRNDKNHEKNKMIWLYGGLGQLVDGSEGHGIFNLATDKPVHKAKEWVGWKNDSIWQFMESNNKAENEIEDDEHDDYYEYDENYDNNDKVGMIENKEISFTKNGRKNHGNSVNDRAQADDQGSSSKSKINDNTESEKKMGIKNREFYTSMLEHYNTQMYNEPVVSILFEFEKPRNFSSVRIHCNNMFRKGVKIFKLAVLYFSLYPDFRDEPSLFRKKKDYADFKAQKLRHRRAMNSHNYYNFSSNLHSYNYPHNPDGFMSFHSSNYSALQHLYQPLNYRRQLQRKLKLKNQTFEKQGLKKILKMPQNKIKANIKTPQKRNLRYLTSKHYPQNDRHYKKDSNRLFLKKRKVGEYLNEKSKMKSKLQRNKRRIENPKWISPKAFSSKQRREDSFKYKHNGPNSPPVIQFFSRDKLIDYARNVNIMIGNRIGKYVRVDLYFDDKWLLISEVRFESEVLSENYTQLLYSRSKSRKGSFFSKSSLDDRLIGIIIGAVGIPILIILVLVLLCLYCHLKHKGSNEKLADEETKSNMHTADGIPLKKIENNGFFTYNNTIFNQNNFTLRQPSNKNNNTFFNNNHFKNHNNDTNTTTVTSLGTTSRKNVDHDKILKYTLNSHGTVDQVTWEGHLNDPFVGASPMQRELPDIPLIPFDSNDYLTDTNNSTYAVPDHYRIAHPPSAYPTNHIYHFDLLGDQSINQRSKTLLTHKGGTNDSMIWNNLTQLKKRNLRLIKKLGEGVFGEVHLCEVDTSVQASGLNKTRVIGAVKVLTKNDSNKIKENFLQEVKVMSKLNDPNVVSVLGVCLKDLPWFVVFEYNSKGDLNQFLRSRVELKGNDLYEPNETHLSYGSLVYMASQISSGMKYLESFNVVHRDLATRNCLVGNQLQVKISDLGVISDLYKSDYFRLQGHTLLPIRWMSWEAVVLGKFSSKSDVWSFGVTLWEVLTHAMKRPFEDLSDQEVLEGLAQCPQTGIFTLCLEQPVNCPREIYDLMCECWNPDEMKRPSFNEICMFLSRKNMGYKPSDDYVDDGKSVLDEYETVVETGFPFADGANIAGESYDAKKNEVNNNIEKSSSKRSVLV